MFRSGIFLMASFIGVAGLFILLLADLIALLQVMMYIGGMLVMILLMLLLFSHDPGGAMMSTQMTLKGPEKWFSLGLARPQDNSQQHHSGDHHSDAGDDSGSSDTSNSKHSGGDMSMFTAIKRPAALLAVLVGMMLIALLLWRPHWAIVHALPDQDSPTEIGRLLMEKYMIAFEGAGLLILLGIFGAVMVQHPAHHPDTPERNRLQAAMDETPPPVGNDLLEPEVLDLREGER
jgi:NADH-quinone oxidoreductase subunit J